MATAEGTSGLSAVVLLGKGLTPGKLGVCSGSAIPTER